MNIGLVLDRTIRGHWRLPVAVYFVIRWGPYSVDNNEIFVIVYGVRTPAQVFQAAIECSHNVTTGAIYVLTSLINSN